MDMYETYLNGWIHNDNFRYWFGVDLSIDPKSNDLFANMLFSMFRNCEISSMLRSSSTFQS